MDKSRPRAMDITAPRQTVRPPRKRLQRRQVMIVAAIVLIGTLTVSAMFWYQHRNDQTIMRDRYQVVYLVTGKFYFGKLQSTQGSYMTIKGAYTIESQPTTSASPQSTATANTSKILKVSQQVYGADDSIAIRSDQVQFWQNLRSDSKVAQAMDAAAKQ